ncbi:helix-turn-helix domain-containing protein [Lysinibacillus sp. NPDC056232]|uniref:helix-turn-helix domain-containing protein n=1 Tax=Lysinibacillus sp. NPDC056232 TaxID=3345756 RepID=UPI0035E0D552
MHVGKVIRDIRINKNIPSNKVYKNILSRPAIAKFEKGLSDTTVEKFFKILNVLNITLEEFEVIYKNAGNKDLLYTRKYIEAYYKKNVAALKQIAFDVKKEYLETGNEKFRHYQALVLLLIEELNGTNKCREELDVIQNYLMNCNSWGYYEVTLFTNTLSFYSNELIDLVYSRAMNTLLILKNLKRYRNEVALMLFNILEIKIVSKKVSSAKFYLTELNNIKLDVVDNMYIQAMIKYFTAILDLIDGKYQEDVVFKIAEMFEFLGLDSKKSQCLSFYNKVKTLYSIA